MPRGDLVPVVEDVEMIHFKNRFCPFGQKKKCITCLHHHHLIIARNISWSALWFFLFLPCSKQLVTTLLSAPSAVRKVKSMQLYFSTSSDSKHHANLYNTQYRLRKQKEISEFNYLLQESQWHHSAIPMHSYCESWTQSSNGTTSMVYEHFI